MQQQRLCGVPMEPRGALARWDADAGELTVWTSTQAPFRIRSSLARMLGLDEARVRVIAPDVGGGFGVKGGPYREEVLVAWLARRLGRPVKWISTRAEDLLTTNHGRGGKSTGELALDAEGRITGLRARIRQPLGSSLAVTVGGTPQNHGRCLPGSYLVEHVDIESVGVFTTTPPVGAYRGAGRPEAAFLIERLVDEAARSLSGRSGRAPPAQPDPARSASRSRPRPDRSTTPETTPTSWIGRSRSPTTPACGAPRRQRRAARRDRRRRRRGVRRALRARLGERADPRGVAPAPCSPSPGRARTARATRRRSPRSSPTSSGSTPRRSPFATATRTARRRGSARSGAAAPRSAAPRSCSRRATCATRRGDSRRACSRRRRRMSCRRRRLRRRRRARTPRSAWARVADFAYRGQGLPRGRRAGARGHALLQPPRARSGARAPSSCPYGSIATPGR